jgi:cephalosporin hydroxylase
MVALGCYFVVEDGIVDVMDWPQYQPGPLVAVQRFLSQNSSFVMDERSEKFVLTYAPGEFLSALEARKRLFTSSLPNRLLSRL